MTTKAVKKRVQSGTAVVMKPKTAKKAFSSLREKAIKDAFRFVNQHQHTATNPIPGIGLHLLKPFFQKDVAKVHVCVRFNSFSFQRQTEYPHLTSIYSTIFQLDVSTEPGKHLKTVAALQQFMPILDDLLRKADSFSNMVEMRGYKHKRESLIRKEDRLFAQEEA